MKKKSPRGIPDFSRRTPGAKDSGMPETSKGSKGSKSKPPGGSPRGGAPSSTPQSTPPKGGQRGK